MSTRLQQGIAFQSGHKPSPYYRLLLLDAAAGASSAATRDSLQAVHEMLDQLASGAVRELVGQPADRATASAELFDGLEHLMAFGRRLFDSTAHDPPLTTAPQPDFLTYLPGEGPFPALRWESSTVVPNRAERDIAIQLTASSQAAVNCAAVEIWKLLEDLRSPLRAVASFDGFGRSDGRGWLDFHDGVSNLQSSQRSAALEAVGDPAWMSGGTYMAFLRIVVDLGAWRRLPRNQQELVVGRDKLSGAGLVATRVDETGEVQPIAALVPDEPDDRQLAEYFEPPRPTDPVLEASHIHRANRARSSPYAPAALRMYRQGYEFLEEIDGRPRLGLNFVSFQRDLSVIEQALHQPGWFGDANFGGQSSPNSDARPPLQLLTVSAGGFYAVPPAATLFPGAEILGAK
jgi:Dyp-type peroxidase family